MVAFRRYIIIIISLLLTFQGYSQIARVGVIASSYHSALDTTDTDAQRFIDSTGMTDATQKTAIRQLVADLKTASLWTKYKAIYPFIGGSSAKHAFNLVNPALYKLTFVGSATHDAGGVLWDGTTGYANTGLACNANTINNTHLSYYSTTESTTLSIEIGGRASTATSFVLGVRSSGSLRSDAYNTTTGSLTIAQTTSIGFFVGTRTSSTAHTSYRNGVQRTTTASTNTGTLSAANIYIGCFNSNGTAASFSNKKCAFASVGEGLTGAQVTTFYNIVQTYQTTLSRNI